MSDLKTNCSSCGCQIQQRTAEKYRGLCAPCHRKATNPHSKVVQSFPPISRAQLDDLIIQRSPYAVIDALFDPACDKVHFRPAEMTDGDIIVFTIWTFLGEICNGGIIQFLDHQSDWAHRCGQSLRQIGAEKYADIIDDCILAFTNARSTQDPQWELDLEAYWDAHDKPFEDIENHFWDLYNVNKEELPDLLYTYICANRDLFAPFSMRA